MLASSKREQRWDLQHLFRDGRTRKKIGEIRVKIAKNLPLEPKF